MVAALLVMIVIVACGLRVTNLDWDRGSHLHPDERFLTLVNEEISAPAGPADYFDTASSSLNPANYGEWYVYGTAPLFLTKGVSTWLHHGAATGAQPARTVVGGLDSMGVDLLDRDGEPTFDGGYDSERVGRLLSALIDTLTTLAVFELARLAGGRRAGLAGAFVWATSVLAIQHAHFFVMEPLLVLATASVLVAAAHVALGKGRVVLALGAVAVGVAGASKVNGLLVAVVLVAAIIWKHLDERRWRAAAIDVAIVVAGALVTFRVLQPYAFDGLFSLDGRWMEAMRQLYAAAERWRFAHQRPVGRPRACDRTAVASRAVRVRHSGHRAGGCRGGGPGPSPSMERVEEPTGAGPAGRLGRCCVG